MATEAEYRPGQAGCPRIDPLRTMLTLEELNRMDEITGSTLYSYFGSFSEADALEPGDRLIALHGPPRSGFCQIACRADQRETNKAVLAVPPNVPTLSSLPLADFAGLCTDEIAPLRLDPWTINPRAGSIPLVHWPKQGRRGRLICTIEPVEPSLTLRF